MNQLRYNPFQPNKIVSPYMFIGRAEEIREIEQCLYQTKMENPHHFLIEGERGIGKSSLLLFVTQLARGQINTDRVAKFDFITLSTDLTGHQTQIDVIRSIARQLKQAVADRHGLKDKLQKVLDFASRFEAAGFRFNRDNAALDQDDLRDELVSNIAEVVTASKADGLVLVIDEADKAGPDARLGEFLKLFTERLEMKGCSKVLLGLAGLPTTVATLKQSHESSPRLFEIMKLDPLEPDERLLVIRKGLKLAEEKNGFETSISDQAAEMIADLSEGYPHFLQQFAYSAFAADTDNNIDSEDVNVGANVENGALAQLGRKYFNEMYYYKIGSSEYRKVLQVMAASSDNWVARKDIISGAGISQTTADNALRALKERGIILVDEGRKGKGFYRLPTKSFAAWINATKPYDGDLFSS